MFRKQVFYVFIIIETSLNVFYNKILHNKHRNHLHIPLHGLDSTVLTLGLRYQDMIRTHIRSTSNFARPLQFLS